MILKASQRGGGQNLAAHLLRRDDNEHVEIHDIRGFVADDLHGAFKEAHAISKGTKCKQYLFSMSLNPPPSEDVGIEVFEDSIARAEKELGLYNQPRAIVFHEKEGRRHAHAVWSRIDARTMTAKQMSFYKTKLRDLTRDIFIEQGWKMPRGLADPSQRDPRNFSLAEWQQAKRAGTDPRATKGAVQDAWAISDTSAGFEHALQERGYWLAKGDRRGHVVIDTEGEIYSLPRMLGKKTKDVRERLGDVKDLKSVSDTMETIAGSMLLVMKRHIEHAKNMHHRKMADIDTKRLAMREKHQDARTQMVSKQRTRQEVEAKARQENLPKGLRGLWSRVTGKYKQLKHQNEVDAARCDNRDRSERNRLVSIQLKERRRLQQHIVSTRKSQVQLLNSLRKDAQRFRKMAEPRAPNRIRNVERGPKRNR
ncbi:MAG: relaxase [Pseudomonadota bacterium]